MNPERKLFFLHIPKCGGTSLDRAIGNLFPNNARARLGSAPSHQAARLLGEPLGAYREHLLLYMLSQPMKRFVAGHFSWSDVAYRHFHPEWTFITVLREPVSRWLSNYFYRRYKKSDYSRTDMGLLDFLESAEGVSEGRKAVRQLAAPELRRDAPRDLAALQASARENLGKFDLVGFVEHDGLCRRQQLAEAFFAQCHVGEEQVMVHNQDVRGGSFSARTCDKATAAVVLAA